MRNQGVKGLLVAVVVLLLLNLAAQFGMGAAKEQAPARGRVVGITSAGSGDTTFLFRAFEDGRMEVSPIRLSVLDTVLVRWSPLVIMEPGTKPTYK
jgi:hypothetical protein